MKYKGNIEKWEKEWRTASMKERRRQTTEERTGEDIRRKGKEEPAVERTRTL